MSLGAIPWTAIREYAIEHEVKDFDFFYDVIRQTDLGFLQHEAERHEKENEQRGRR